MNGTTVALYAGLTLAVLGATVFLAPTFGFSTVSVDRLSGVGAAADDEALVGFEQTAEAIETETDDATAFVLRNNADEELSLATTVTTSPADLGVADTGAATLQPGETSQVVVDCGDLDSEVDASVAVTVDDASGSTLSIQQATSSTTVSANCGPDRIDDPASTETVSPHRYGVENVESGLVAEVADASTAENATIQQALDAGADEQRFAFEHVGDGRYRLEPVHSGMAVGVANATRSVGGNLTQQSWSDDDDHQLWHAEEVVDGEYRLVANHSGLVAAVADGSHEEGTHVEQVEWTNESHQRWVLEPESPSLTWISDADWSAGTHERTVSDDVGDRENDTVRLGYEPVGDGLVSYWPLDEESGSTAFDATGNNDGTHQNDPVLGATGLLSSTAYDFDGTSSYVRVPHDESLEFASADAVTVSVWVEPDSLSGESRTAIAQKSDTSYNLQLQNDQPAFTVHDGDDWYSATWSETLVEGQLYHLVGTYDGDETRLYVDGTQVANESVPGTLNDSDDHDLGVARNLDGSVADRHFDASLDELRLYGRGLSEGEVATLYDTASDGTHVTDWKSSTVDLSAEEASLQNVSATLGGETATVRVQSDVDGDGTVDETSDPVTLTETDDSYDVTGLSTDAARFRLQVNLSTSDPTVSPIVSEVELRERLEDPYFDVSIDDTNSPVEERETLTVTATITNTGEQSDTQSIRLEDFGGVEVDSTEVSLEGAESTQVTLSWATEEGDAGTGDVTVRSDDDSELREVTIEEFERFTVTDVGQDVSGGERQYFEWVPAEDEDRIHAFRLGDPHPDVDYGNVTNDDITIESGQDIYYEWLTPDDGHDEHYVEFDMRNIAAEETLNISIENYWTSDIQGPWTVNLTNEHDDTFVDDTTFDLVRVEEFDVAIESVDDPVVEGEPLDVTANVSNSGEGEGTQTIALDDFDGTQVDATDVTLAAGESQSLTLTWSTQAGDNGTGNVTVRSDDDSDEAEATVKQQATFSVTVDGTNSPVAVGEDLLVDATITNDGDVEGTQTITLSTDDAVRDDQSLTLQSGESQSITLAWATADGDVGIYDAVVASEDDSDAASVSVVRPNGPIWETDADWSDGTAVRTVSDDVGDRENDTVRLGYSADSTDLVSYWPLDEDDGSVAVDAAGDNDGDHVGDGISVGQPGLLNSTGYAFEDTGRVEVPADDSLHLSNDLTVSVWLKTDALGTVANDENNQTYFVDKSNFESDGYALFDNGDFTDEVIFRVNEEENFHDAGFDRALVNDGEWHHVVGVRDGQEIRVYVDGELQDTVSNTGLDQNTDSLGIGGTVGGGSVLDGQLEEVRLSQGALSDEQVQDRYQTTTNGTYTTEWQPTGDPLNASSLALENVTAAIGPTNATVYLESDVQHDGSVDETSDPIHLTDADDRYALSGLTVDPDRVRLRVEFETDDVAATPIVSRIAVTETEIFDVAIDDTNSPVTEGETLSVNATVENVGQETGTQTIELQDFEGAVVDQTDVELAAGENASVTLEWHTEAGDAGTGDVTVASDDDSDVREVSIQTEGTYFDVAIDDTNSPVVEGEALDVNVTVDNVGDEAGTQTIELRDFENAVVDDLDVTLGAGETNDSIVLTWATEEGDNGTDDVTVASENATATREVTVETAAPDIYFEEYFEGGTSDVNWQGADFAYDITEDQPWRGDWSLNHHTNDHFWSEGALIETNSTISGYFRADANGYEHPMVVLGADASEGIGVGLDKESGDGEFFLAEYDGGTRTDLATPATIGDTNDQWWRIELDVEEDGDDLLVEARLYDTTDETLEATLTGTVEGGVTEYGSSGSIAFRGDRAWDDFYYWDDLQAEGL